MLIPCDTIVRLSALVGSEPPFNVLRLDHGRVIATDRRFAAVERVANFDLVTHILVTPALIEQCKRETDWSGAIEITPNDMLAWTTAKSLTGWTSPDNLFAPSDPLYDRWHEKLVEPALTEPSAPSGYITAHADELARLAHAAPSGTVTFERVVDVRRPLVVRDADSSEWCGFFIPRLDDGRANMPATVPGWLREA